MSDTAFPPVSIRRAVPGDMPALGRLGELLVRAHHAYDRQRFMAPTRGTASGYAGFLGSRIDAPDVFVLVAEVGGAVVGYLYGGVEGTDWMSLRGPAGVLHDIVVDEAHRGRGIGRRLLDAAIAELRTRGAPRAVLSTAARNVDAQRLFASAGFRQTMLEMTRELP